MSFEITGTIVQISETETKGESFKVRDFVIENKDGQYSNFVKFQTSQERTSMLDDYTEGQEVKVHFDLRGRQWQDRYFTNRYPTWTGFAVTGFSMPGILVEIKCKAILGLSDG